MRHQFGPGNKFGKGNKAYQRIAEHREALLKCTKIKDIKAVMAMLVDKACRCKDVQAARVYLEYTCGKPMVIEGGNISIAEGENRQIIISVNNGNDKNDNKSDPQPAAS